MGPKSGRQPPQDGGFEDLVCFEDQPFFSVELGDVLPSVRLVSMVENSTSRSLKQRGMNIISYQGVTGNGGAAFQRMMSDDRFLRSCLAGDPPCVFSPGMTKLMGQLRRNYGACVAVVKSPLRQRLGNKLRFQTMCRNLGLPHNQTIEFAGLTSGEFANAFSAASDRLGLPFVVQSKWGAGGVGTFLIESTADLESHFLSLRDGCRMTRFIPDCIPYSTQGCVGDVCLPVRGPFLQLVGLPELTPDRFQFVGDDTNTAQLSAAQILFTHTATLKIAGHLKAEGFRGLFGVDFLFDPATEALFVQEVNPRPPVVANLVLAIQKDQGRDLDIFEHLTGFEMPPPFSQTGGDGAMDMDIQGRAYAQVDLRNTAGTSVLVPASREPGVFEIEGEGIKRIGSALCLNALEGEQIGVIYFPDGGSTIQPGEMLCRIMLKRQITDTSTSKISGWGKAIIGRLTKHILSSV
jgi:hypothetical protein